MTTDEITTNQHKEIFMKKKSRLMLASGATYSSEGILGAIQKALAQALA